MVALVVVVAATAVVASVPAAKCSERRTLSATKVIIIIISILALFSLVAYKSYTETLILHEPIPFSTTIPLNWKNYINESYGFTFNYPDTYDVLTKNFDNNDSVVIYLNPTKIAFPSFNYHGRISQILIQVSPIGLSDIYYSSDVYQARPTANIGQANITAKISEEITGKEDTRTDMKDVHYLSYSFVKDSNAYTISFQESNELYESQKQIFDQILSTFNFLD